MSGIPQALIWIPDPTSTLTRIPWFGSHGSNPMVRIPWLGSHGSGPIVAGPLPLFDGPGGYVYSARMGRHNFRWECGAAGLPHLAWSNGSHHVAPKIGWHANGWVGRRILADVDRLPVPKGCVHSSSAVNAV